MGRYKTDNCLKCRVGFVVVCAVRGRFLFFVESIGMFVFDRQVGYQAKSPKNTNEKQVGGEGREKAQLSGTMWTN